MELMKMGLSFGIIVTFAGVLLLAGVLSNKLSSKFNMPILLLFLAVGMLVGAHGLGIIHLEPEKHASPINALGTVAMCFILFSGGLGTSFHAIRPVIRSGVTLATCGVVLTALFLGICGYLICLAFHHDTGLAWWMLMASIFSSTDAAALFAILRGNGVNLSGNLQPLLELESGSNDPMAALLTLVMLQIVTAGGGFSFWQIPLLFYKIIGGAMLGLFLGMAGKWLFSQRFEYEGLYYVLGVALVLICFGVAELCHTNGFLAVYVCGVAMGNQKYNFRGGLAKFNEGIAWLMQVILFTSLGVLVNPMELLQLPVLIPGIALSLCMMFIARPGAVFLSLIRSPFSVREKLLVSWAGLRGAAPIVLATFPLVAGVANSKLMFNMVFFMVIGSVLVQGVTLMPLARKLKLARNARSKSRVPVELETVEGVNYDLHEFEVDSSSVLVGMTLAEAKLPPGALVSMIRRGKGFVPACGCTIIEAGDDLVVMGAPEKLHELSEKYFPESGYAQKHEVPRFLKKNIFTRNS